MASWVWRSFDDRFSARPPLRGTRAANHRHLVGRTESLLGTGRTRLGRSLSGTLSQAPQRHRAVARFALPRGVTAQAAGRNTAARRVPVAVPRAGRAAARSV